MSVVVSPIGHEEHNGDTKDNFFAVCRVLCVLHDLLNCAQRNNRITSTLLYKEYSHCLCYYAEEETGIYFERMVIRYNQAGTADEPCS